MLTPLILRAIHNQQVREIERVVQDSQSPTTTPWSTLRQQVGRGLIRVGHVVAAETHGQQANPC